MRYLDADPEDGDVYFPKTVCQRFVFDDGTDSGRIMRAAKGSQKVKDSMRNVLMQPKSKTFPYIDIFILDEDTPHLIQSTASAQHPVKLSGIQMVIDNLSAEATWQDLRPPPRKFLPCIQLSSYPHLPR